jgi:large subunit ribosomal protein L23
MNKQNPYQIIKSRHVTEKSTMLESLKDAESNASVRRCKSPKFVFIVDIRAKKQEIAKALEEIYADKNIKVTKVNTITNKPKTRRVRGRIGAKSAFKKAIVTLDQGDTLDNI